MTWLSVAVPVVRLPQRDWQLPEENLAFPSDTTDEDDSTNVPYKKSRRPTYKPRDRYGDRFNNPQSTSPLLLKTPGNVQPQYQADSAGNVTIYEKAGGVDYRPPTRMTFEQFNEIQNRQVLRNYWRSKSEAADGKSAVANKRIIPKINAGPLIDRLFGGSYVDFQPNGFVNLNFAGQFQRVDNPTIPIRQQRNGNFLFDQQASVNFTGKIGEKLKVTANYDTKASFNFENNIKVAYTAFEEDIIQKIEVGNVSMPINSTLITGAQNLFGFRTQLKFGRLNVGLIAANQRSKTDAINVKGGVQTKNFEIREDTYDENRHFFLSQYFRNKYEASLKNLPLITSGVNITRLEVYVTNRNNNTQTLRNVVGLSDLGEPAVFNVTPTRWLPSANQPVANGTNKLYETVTSPTYAGFRVADKTNDILGQAPGGLGLQKAVEYELLRSSRKLDLSEYTFNPQLGYLSLNTALRNDEILAVAYEYSLNGRTYKVGELTEDYSTRRDDEVIALKLIKSSTLRNNTVLPMWDLMMKNIYSLNASQINRVGFQLRIIYKNDLTGIDSPYLQEGRRLKEVPLVQVFGLDRLNPQLDPQVDGNFDYVEGITIDSRNGRIIFPVLEPFGSYLASTNTKNNFRFESDEAILEAKYLNPVLYRSTQAEAAQLATKNKFFIKGSFQSTSSNEIILPGIGVDENSISVTAGGVPLVAGQDYIVEAQLGRLRIINESVLASGQEIKVNFEKPDLFNNQIKTLLGARLDYQINKDFNIGATAMRLRERPTLTRIGIGNEPVNNSIFGVDANFKKDSRFLTKLVDKLPFLQTKEVSTITFGGEYATLKPGVAPLAQSNAFIDDFEGSETPFDLTRQPTKWRLGATPKSFPGAPPSFSEADVTSDGKNPDVLRYAHHRAKLSWYNIDNVFYRDGGRGKPDNITPIDKQSHYERGILQQEIFPNRSKQQLNVNETTFDLAYFPAERGPYNYTTDLTSDGRLRDSLNTWGSISRAMTYDIDFDNSNVQYIEFWLMDPFIKDPVRGRVLDGVNNTPNSTGGKLYFNLGNVSEDVMRDGHHAFENGLPANPADPADVSKTSDENAWGRVTKQQFLTNAFANTARKQQDVGLDGLSNEEEKSKFPAFANVNDPSADDFQYYLGPDLDAKDAQIVERYKNYYGMEANSPEVTGNEIYTPSSSSLPDNEDLNTDQTINDEESYYQYEVDLRPGKLVKGQGYVVDNVVSPDGTTNWYQMRIPIREFTSKYGNINGFKSIRFMRLFMTGFKEPVVLRMAQFQLVANQWRSYQGDMTAKGLVEIPEAYDAQFKVTTVNVEENSQQVAGKVPYTLPPGFIRDRDISTLNNRQINEQSLKLSVTDLKDGDARAIFKNSTFDFINYKRLRMYVHAEANGLGTLQDGDVRAFIRVGTDFTDNYYEIEMPLKISQFELPPYFKVEPNSDDSTRHYVWPNEFNVPFSELVNTKAMRNNGGGSPVVPFLNPNLIDGKFRITVVGNPDLSSVQTIMIGMRNPKSSDEAPKSFTIWTDELRASQFDEEGGYAALGRLNVKLADFANITATGRIQTYGFGGIQQKISERARENTTQWGVVANVALDKIMPKQLGLRVPMLVSYEKQTITPRFNPLDPDTPLDISLERFADNDSARNAYRRLVVDQTVKRSINFTNVQKVKTKQNAKTHLYDIENFSASYAYSDVIRSNTTIDSYAYKLYHGSLAYTYNNKVKAIEPFKNVTWLSSPYLKLIKDFNFSLAPSSITIRGDLDRQFIRTQLRNGSQGTAGILPTFEKYYTFNRFYDVRWNLTQNLALDYTATVNAVVDEPVGDIDTQSKRDSVKYNLLHLGRMKNYDQRVGVTYRVPFDKIPFTDWLNADVTYGARYTWTASSYGIKEDSTNNLFGNTIQNNRERGVTGKVDLLKLYNKVKFLKDINSPPVRRPAPPANTNPVANAKDTTKTKPPRDFMAFKVMLRALMTARSLNFTYTIQENTILPGYLGTPRFLGMDSSFTHPGLPFILGSQDPNIRIKLAEQGLLSKATTSNLQFVQGRITNLNVQTALEPFKDFRIQLNAKKSETLGFQEFYRDTLGGDGTYKDLSPVRTGSYNISFISLKTAFFSSSNPDASVPFQRFQDYRHIIQQQLEARNPNVSDTISYNPNSQDVLLASFLAAYGGKDPKKASLSPFPSFPLPNWRLDYAGLAKLDAFKTIFSQINITHSYTSTYSVGNYTSSQEYQNAALLGLNNNNYPIPDQKNTQGQFIPVYVVTQASIVERFAPLIGINVRTQSKITARLEYTQERSLTLTLNNSQLSELVSKGLVIGAGYSKTNFKIPFRIEGRTVTLKNQLDFRFDLTIRDTRTIQRKLETTSADTTGTGAPGGTITILASNTITAGNTNFQLKPSINYVLNQRLNLQIYFERTVNNPLITSSYRRSNTTFGVQLRFNLTE